MTIPAFGNSVVVEMFPVTGIVGDGDTGWWRLEEEDTDFVIDISGWAGTSAQLFIEADLGIVGGSQRVYQAATTTITGNGTWEPRVDLAAIPGGSRVRARWVVNAAVFSIHVRAVETRNGQPAS